MNSDVLLAAVLPWKACQSRDGSVTSAYAVHQIAKSRDNTEESDEVVAARLPIATAPPADSPLGNFERGGDLHVAHACCSHGPIEGPVDLHRR